MGDRRVLAAADIFLFEEFRLDRQGDGLSRRNERGAFVPLSIGRRALDVLAVLVERSGELVSKEEIMAAVWGHMVVENANLTVQISALRRVLDEGRTDGSCIQTIAARGYRFAAAVTRVERAIPAMTTGSEVAVALPAVNAIRLAPRRNRAKFAAVAAATVALVVFIVTGVWPALRAPSPSAPVATSAQPAAPRLSIVVLPFTDLSEERGQQYRADAITDDVTTDLSRIPGMLVIARNTAFTFRDRPVDAKQIGRELGVRYILEGSVRRSGNQLRVNSQLIDAGTNAHLWAQRFDRDTGHSFAVQNEITSQIAVALNIELVGAEAARPTERPDALDYMLRGRAAMWKPRTPESYAESVGFFERALALDPASVQAQSLLAGALSARALDKMTDSAAADFARAEALVGQALEAEPRNPFAHYAKAQLLRSQRRCEEAIPEYETTLTFNRNWVNAIADLGWCKFWTGSIEEAVQLHEQAIHLSPLDPGIGYWHFRIGLVHLLQSRTEEATIWLEKARTAAPTLPFVHLFLASAYGLRGETGRGAVELAEANRLPGMGHATSIAAMRAGGYWGPPQVSPLFEATLFEGLRKVGLPEQ
jgi:TolB-like protein/DNA-binding winged helix-turn-helix (wHTH) protein/Tfp pilus assembly protein PilF